MEGTLPDEIYANPNISGYFLRVPWRAVEPDPGAYDWSVIDKSVHAAKQNGKQVSIGIMAGNLSPVWLYDKGAKKFSCTIEPVGGAVYAAIDIVIPLPWDPVFLTCYTNMIHAMAEHFKADGTYDTISLIKINGINENTAEMRLPHYVGDSGKRPAGKSTNTYSRWKEVGYRPSLVIHAFRVLADMYCTEFPGKPLSLPIIQPDWHAFPAIDESGNLIDKELEHTGAMITSFAIKRYDKRLQVQWNALSCTREPPKVIDQYREGGIPVAFQENIGYCRTLISQYKQQNLPQPYPDDQIRGMFDMGIKHNMEFVELFAITINTFPGAMEYGNELFAQRHK